MTKDAQFNIRMPADLKALLEQAATDNKRSTSAEAINRLHDSFQPSLDREASKEWVELVQERDKLKEELNWATSRMFESLRLLTEAQAMNARLLETRQSGFAEAEAAATHAPKPARVKA